MNLTSLFLILVIYLVKNCSAVICFTTKSTFSEEAPESWKTKECGPNQMCFYATVAYSLEGVRYHHRERSCMPIEKCQPETNFTNLYQELKPAAENFEILWNCCNEDRCNYADNAQDPKISNVLSLRLFRKFMGDKQVQDLDPMQPALPNEVKRMQEASDSLRGGSIPNKDSYISSIQSNRGVPVKKKLTDKKSDDYYDEEKKKQDDPNKYFYNDDYEYAGKDERSKGVSYLLLSNFCLAVCIVSLLV